MIVLSSTAAVTLNITWVGKRAMTITPPSGPDLWRHFWPLATTMLSEQLPDAFILGRGGLSHKPYGFLRVSSPLKLCCTLPGVHYLECFILVVSIIFTEQFMFSLSFLKNWLLEFTKVLQSMEPKDKNLHKTTKIPSFFFCIPVFHSSFLYLTYPTIFCNFFTLSACRVKTKN